MLYKNGAIKVFQEMDASNGRLYLIDGVLSKNGVIARHASGINLTDIDIASMYFTKDNDFNKGSKQHKCDLMMFFLFFLVLVFYPFE